MMMQLVTDAVISKGYGGAPAFHSSEDGRMLSFKIGCKVYDKRADKETRWVNFNVNAFDDLAERVRRMNLKEGSHINVMGNFDMKPWRDHHMADHQSRQHRVRRKRASQAGCADGTKGSSRSR